MAHHRSLISGLILALGLTALPTPIQASELLTCESQNGRYTFCPARTLQGVELSKQLSDTNCRFNRTWGYDDRGIWVDQGCRAVFRLGSGRPQPDMGFSTLTCTSQNFRYRYCPANTYGGVQLDKQLSDRACRLNRTWGYDRGGIWVDEGCSGRFLLGQGYDTSNRPSSNSSSGNTSAIVGGAIALGVLGAILSSQGGQDSRTVTCSSKEGQYTVCAADTRNGVTLKRQLSDASCWLGQTWGYNDQGIWVDQGCRGEFQVR